MTLQERQDWVNKHYRLWRLHRAQAHMDGGRMPTKRDFEETRRMMRFACGLQRFPKPQQ
jgi:hypothetical protein